MSDQIAVTPTDAYDLATLASEYGKWLGALMKAISQDAKHGQGHSVAALTSLGRYLTDEMTNYMELEAERIQKAGGFE